uniref:Uncharacterized protein n=1 Tax=Fagus sylvatica TaxID=28930 RepID=A0A2N9EI76_FAGSY
MSDRGSGSGGHRRSDRLAKGKSVIYAPESPPDTDDEYDAMEDVRTRVDASLARDLQAEFDAEAAGLSSSTARPSSRPGITIGRSARPSSAPRQPTAAPPAAPPARSKRRKSDRAPLSADPIPEDHVVPGFRYPPQGGIRPRYPVTTPVADTPLLTNLHNHPSSSVRRCQDPPRNQNFPCTVITPFLPPGFSRVSARKTRQPEPSRSDPTRAHPHQILPRRRSETHFPSIVDKTAYLGGNVCAKILSDPLQLGPRAKTLRQEVHFSYHTQLSDRQELLRSSRNLSQKLTPWHKEHSDGLRSQDHISRTQARLCARPVPLKSRVFLTRNKLICEPGHIGKRTHPCTTWNSRIAKNLSGQRKLSDGTKNVKIRHRELGQICARTGTRFEKKRAGSKTHFFSRTAAFARRVFPARNKLIREPGCVGKIMTPATSWNSRFAESIPRLIGIFIGRVHENSSDTPTSGSHNSLVRTPIRANFISLERGRRELSDDMPHDPF